MGFCEHRTAKIIAEFDDACAEKWKKSDSHNTDFLQCFIKRRQSIKKVIYRKKFWGHRTFKRVKTVHRY